MKRIISIGLLAALAPFFYLMPIVTYAQSNELKAAKEELKESLDRLTKVDTIEARKAALREVIEFSLIGVKELSEKVSNIENIPADYFDVREGILTDLDLLMIYQQDYLKKLDEPALNLEQIKKLAADFKEWREVVYAAAVRKAMNFLLIFQSADILAITNSRFVRIANDVRLLQNSKFLKQEILQGLLSDARVLLKEANRIHKEAAALFLDDVAQPRIQEMINDFIQKIKEIYGKFLEMSSLVKKSGSK